MSTDGKTIFDFVKEIRKFCQNISELLGTADQLMVENEWGEPYGICLDDPAFILKRPTHWFPNTFFRFYRHNKIPLIRAFVAVMLDDRCKEEDYGSFNETLISAGWFVYRTEKEIESGEWYYWFANFHGYMENRRDDGSLHVVNPKRDWPKKDNDEYDYNFITAHTFAIPLVLITDTDALKSKIIDKLVSEIRNSMK